VSYPRYSLGHTSRYGYTVAMDRELAQLHQFLREHLSQGVSEDALRTALKEQGGWQDHELDMAIASVRADMNDRAALEQPAGAQPVPQSQQDDQSQAGGLQQQASGGYSGSVAQAPTQPTTSFTQPQGAPSDSGAQETATMMSHPALTKGSGGLKTALIILGILVAVGALAAGGYVFVRSSDMLSSAPYGEEDLLTGMWEKGKSIKTATFDLSGAISMVEREADAKPFELDEGPEMAAYREAYKRDAKRMDAVRDAQIALSYFSYSQHNSSILSIESQGNSTTEQRYPASLEEAADVTQGRFDYVDPLTGEPYQYRLYDNGADYELVVTFETDDAISEIRNSYWFDPDAVTINDKTVTVTSEARMYARLSSEPPKPFLVELSEQARMLPPEFDANVSVRASADFTDTNTDFDVSAEGELDMGDLAFKVAVDARKVADQYFARIRNLPSMGLFTMMLGTGFEKNVWIELPSDNDVEYIGEELSEVRAEVEDALDDVVRIASEERIYLLRGAPVKEEVEGRQLYRYDVRINKEAIVPYMRRVLEEVVEPRQKEFGVPTGDDALLRYLEGEEFEEMFDYLDANTSMTYYVDADGYPARAVYGARLVPPDTAVQLADKQANTTVVLSLDNIDKQLSIKAPKDTKTMEEVMEEYRANMDYSMDLEQVSDAAGMSASVIQSFMGRVGFPFE